MSEESGPVPENIRISIATESIADVPPVHFCSAKASNSNPTENEWRSRTCSYMTGYK